MQPADLSRYMQNPASMGAETVKELFSLVEQFPYFQPAHLLLSLAAHRHDAATYQRTLKKTAIVVTNRARLFELINAQEQQKIGVPAPSNVQRTVPAAKSPPESDLDLLKIAENSAETTVIPEKTATDPEAQLEKEIGRHVVTAFVEKEVLKIPDAATPPRHEPASFGDWLAYLKKNNGQPYQEIERQVKKEKMRREEKRSETKAGERKEKNRAIIDNIIEKNPGHIRVKEDQKFFTPESSAKESLLDNEHLVTETLAWIYALQGNTGKAIRAYQILSLKNPQKSAYFAGLIEKLRNNDKSE